MGIQYWDPNNPPQIQNEGWSDWMNTAPGSASGNQNQNPNSSYGPSNDPWAGINPQLAAIYKAHGINTPGAAGMGFTDAAYWNDKPSQWDRLAADLEGRGSDQPGPGDVGNKSGQGQNQNGGQGNDLFSRLASMFGMGGAGARPYNQYAGKFNANNQPIQQGFRSYPNSNNSMMTPTSTNGTAIGTQYSPSMASPMSSGMSSGMPSQSGMAKPRYNWSGMNTGNNPSMNSNMNSSPMGAPSFYKPYNQYQAQRNQAQPLANNNFTGM